jgi:hypothetical protein
MSQTNIQDSNNLTIHLSGQLTINRQALKSLLADMMPANLPAMPAPQPVEVKPLPPPKPLRLAYTMKETAALLGVSYITVHRLVQRRLLKSSLAVRCKIIPLVEIQRFLRETL